jgi:predicted small secreted protein
MPRILWLVLATTLLAACDNKAKPTVDITRGGAKAMERAQDVSKVLEQGAARTREAEQGDDAAKKGRE